MAGLFITGNKEHKNITGNIINTEDYLSRGFNIIVMAMAKNEEFVANSWKSDLNRINDKFDDFYNKIFKDGGIPVYNNRGEFEGIAYKGAYYINLNNKEALEAVLKENNITTTEKLELNPIKWQDLSIAINIFDDYLKYGYDNKLQALQKNYPKYVFNNLMYLRTADFKRNRDKDTLKGFIKSCNDLGLSDKIYERLTVNEALLKSFNYDYHYELIDEYDIYALIKERDVDVSFINANYKDKAMDTIRQIKDAGQAYINTDKGRFYLPIIKTNEPDGKYMSFSESEGVINKLPIVVEYESNGINYADIFQTEEVIGKKIDFNMLCSRTGYNIPYEFTDPKTENKQYENEYEM
jgi:hypothetical protein